MLSELLISSHIDRLCAVFRDFVEEGVVDYAKQNPGTVVYVSPQPGSGARVVAEYRECVFVCFHHLKLRLYADVTDFTQFWLHDVKRPAAGRPGLLSHVLLLNLKMSSSDTSFKC